MIVIKNLKKQFGNQIVLDGVSVSIQKGEIVAILGASGSGKSTFLRCINLMEQPCAGEVFVDKNAVTQTSIHQIRDKIGMVFQNFHLFSHLSVMQNLIYAPMKVQHLSYEKAVEKANKLLNQVGLEKKASAFWRKMNGQTF